LKQAGAKKEKKDKTEKIPKADKKSSTKTLTQKTFVRVFKKSLGTILAVDCSMEVGYTPFK